MSIDPTILAASSGLLGTSMGIGTAETIGDKSDAFSLGRDDFFKLFLAQLANQDPTRPVDDKEFITQLAQFTMIDTMKAVEKALEGSQLGQASGLLGRRVDGIDVSGAPIAGIVDRLVQADGELFLMIGDRSIRPDAVSHVAQA